MISHRAMSIPLIASTKCPLVCPRVRMAENMSHQSAAMSVGSFPRMSGANISSTRYFVALGADRTRLSPIPVRPSSVVTQTISARHSVKVVVAIRRGFIFALRGSASMRSIFMGFLSSFLFFRSVKGEGTTQIWIGQNKRSRSEPPKARIPNGSD